jgi:hypothetical protein
MIVAATISLREFAACRCCDGLETESRPELFEAFPLGEKPLRTSRLASQRSDRAMVASHDSTRTLECQAFTLFGAAQGCKVCFVILRTLLR